MPDNEPELNHTPLLASTDSRAKIVVVSGLPRSGTSMLMKVLHAGGMTLLTDQIRGPDDDNPNGYYEFERVKRLPQGDIGWLGDARGKCVKVISALLTYLPSDYSYDVIFMHRQIGEVLDSQRKMLRHRGQATIDNDNDLALLLQQHVDDVCNWLVNQSNFSLFEVHYNEMLADPATWVTRTAMFVGGHLNTAAMQMAVDATLYRNRRL